MSFGCGAIPAPNMILIIFYDLLDTKMPLVPPFSFLNFDF